MNLAYITWDVSPILFSFNIGGSAFEIRWYGLLFALGFLVGQAIIARIFKIESKPEKDLDTLFIYMIVSTVVGARLGHCIFYDWEYYSARPIEILYVWQGGLASHGAAIGILLALYLYSRKRPGQSFLWVADRITIVVALGGSFIRLGNLMNSEIVGKPTNVAWAFAFVRAEGIPNPTLPRHPAQLYESITMFLLFIFLLWLYNRKKAQTPEGLLLGLFLVIVFTLRFFYEFLKENQVSFEDKLLLNMGQILSIPAVLLGCLILWVAYKNSQKMKIQI
ncbi:MAG: prolipoprotein diacylglyceryl transferase [Microscillaceae bacterium]|nr:prolipoprotein diacylglyceryl transferase [Microscillaceae bacterium]MDW8461138.1 prolipoprotein diacylglyceryl transferase [Cytophagales bacterium]